MAEIQRRLNRALRIVTVLGIIGAGSLCRGQGGEELEEDGPPRAFRADDRQFDRWVLLDNATGGHNRLEASLTSRIREIDKVCRLTASQREKLQLAGRGDIKRYLDRIEDKRKEFELVKNDRIKYLEFSRKIQPLRMQLMSESFGEGSILVKTLAKTLDEGQSVKYGEAERAKKEAAHQALVNRVVATENRTLKLTPERRRKFTNILLKETKLPRRSSPYDVHVVLFQMSHLPEAEIRSILDDFQWGVLSRRFEEARSLEPTLRDVGLLPDAVAPQNVTDR